MSGLPSSAADLNGEFSPVAARWTETSPRLLNPIGDSNRVPIRVELSASWTNESSEQCFEFRSSLSHSVLSRAKHCGWPCLVARACRIRLLLITQDQSWCAVHLPGSIALLASIIVSSFHPCDAQSRWTLSCAIRISMTEILPLAAAWASGDLWSKSHRDSEICVLFTISMTSSVRALMQAYIKGVFPYLSACSVFAPRLMRSCIAAIWPPAVAQDSGVRPFLFEASIFASWSRRASMPKI